MARTVRTVLILLLALAGASAYAADPPGRVGRLNYLSGAVSFAAAEAPDAWVQAAPNRPLTSGDRVWADTDGRAEMHVGSTAVRLAPLTSLDVLNLDDSYLQMRLAQGAVNVRVRDLAQGETVEIATPTGAVLLRQPGSYRISADPQSDAARVLVNFGQAEVVTPAQTVTVPSGQAAVISAQSGIAFEIAAYAQADEFDRWSAERDRAEDRVVSTRYVSREMTGYEDLDRYGAWRTDPQYGAMWVPTQVAPGWAPYRYGHWVWVSPWGWTWVDDAPWGFAPFHYGRWVSTGGYWAWLPGTVVRRPVYAPALVAFVGGSHWSVSVTSGPSVGWFPLGPREPFIPWYRASESHVRNVNVTHVTNVTNIYNNTTNVTRTRYVNQANPQAVTVVPQQAFVSARSVSRSAVNVAPADLARAEVVQARPPVEPVRASFAPGQSGARPPAQAVAREVVAVNPPARAASHPGFAPADGAAAARRFEEPRVRVIGRERAEARIERTNAPASAPAAQAASAPVPASTAEEARGARRGAEVWQTPPSTTQPPRAAERPAAARPPESATAPRAAEAVRTPSRPPESARAEGPRTAVHPEPRPPANADAAARPPHRPEERRREEAPRPRPAPPPAQNTQGQGATNSAAPQREVHYAERAPAAPPHAPHALPPAAPPQPAAPAPAHHNRENRPH